MTGYTCSYRQTFNIFGAPGIPNTYWAVLNDPDGRLVERRRFCWRSKAERQCLRWVQMYGACMVPPIAIAEVRP